MIKWHEAQTIAKGDYDIAEQIWFDALYDHYAYLPPGLLRLAINQAFIIKENKLINDKLFIIIVREVNFALNVISLK